MDSSEQMQLARAAKDFLLAVMAQRQQDPGFHARYATLVRGTGLDARAHHLTEHLREIRSRLGKEHPDYVTEYTNGMLQTADNVAAVCIQIATPSELKSLCREGVAQENLAAAFNACGAKNLAVMHTPWKKFTTIYSGGKRRMTHIPDASFEAG